jgi:hypothetical protein
MLKIHVIFAALFFQLLPSLHAEPSKGPSPAPIPAQIAAAQKVFVSNGGGSSIEDVTEETLFDGGPDRSYNEFYAAMKTWGHYQLAASPGDADLVFEIGWTPSGTDLRLPVIGQLRLVIIDPKMHITLWSINEYVRGAVLLGNRDKNFDQAMNTIVTRLKLLANPIPATANGSSK